MIMMVMRLYPAFLQQIGIIPDLKALVYPYFVQRIAENTEDV